MALQTFQVIYVEFDFDGAELAHFDQDMIAADIIGTHWQADDEEDLTEEITNATGWCIKSLDFQRVLA
jgi:hypothetical protein